MKLSLHEMIATQSLNEICPLILMSRNSKIAAHFMFAKQTFHSLKRISFDRFIGQISLRSQEAYLEASSIATATATVIRTCGLLPAPDNRPRASLQALLASESVKIAPRALRVTQQGA